MKKNKKENIIVNVENVKTKVVYTRKGRRNGKEALV